MKKCPKCGRTYAEDGFTFCLEDGALLSPPYDSDETPAGTVREAEPPPTLPMFSERSPRAKADSPQPTIAAPRPELGVGRSARQPEPAGRRSIIPYVLGLFGAMIILTAVLWYAFRSQCPILEVTCYPSENRALCEVRNQNNRAGVEDYRSISSLRPALALQRSVPDLPAGIKVTWSSSKGKVDNSTSAYTYVDTTGLASQEIDITATFSGTGFLCSNKTSTKFIAH